MGSGRTLRCFSSKDPTHDGLANRSIRGARGRVGPGRRELALGLMLVSSACANTSGSPETSLGLPRTFPAPNKTQRDYQADIANCKQYAIARPASYGTVKIQASYAACMMSLGNNVQFPDGSIRSAQNFQSPQGAQAWILPNTPSPAAPQPYSVRQSYSAEILQSLRERDAEGDAGRVSRDASDWAHSPDGFASVRVDIGEYYENGWIVPKDFALAAKWYQKALKTPGAYHVMQRAAYKFAMLYEHGGPNLPRNHAKAEQIAASAGMVTTEAKAAENNREREQAETLLRAFTPRGPSVSHRQQENGDAGPAIAGGSWFKNEQRYQKEQQMEKINEQRSEPLTRDDSQYEEKNNPSSPQD
jgi:hypothetical protein